MLLTKPQATAVADCLTTLKSLKGLVTVEFSKYGKRVKVIEMFDGSIVLAQPPFMSPRVEPAESYASAAAFRTAYGVA